MAQTIAQHNVASFTTPVNGTSPIDANTVRGNDNTLRVGYNDHDSDSGIHVQSSVLASRPSAGDAGRKWLTTDTGAIKLFFDTGSAWAEISYLPLAGGTVAGNVSITGTLAVTNLLTASGGVAGNLTGNVTGNVTGNASTATALATARNINGVAFDGTANITVTASTPNALTAGTYLTSAGTFDGSAARTFAVDATDANTANKIVARDANGDFSARIITSALNGNAATVTDGVYTTGSYSNPSWITALAGSKITGNISGNAGTATALATARTINGVSFDGTANITVTAAAGTLTGSTLASGVTASSLTSVGTLTSLAVSGTTSLRGVTYTWPLADGTSSYVLSTDGAGQLAWVAQSGGGGGGSGTVNSGTTGYFAYYPSTGTVVDDQTVLYTDGTNLGVGTATVTAAKLVVNGNASLTTGNAYQINGTSVLSASTLGSGVTSSSLTSVGTIGTGVWQGTAISDTYLATISTAGKVSNSATTAASSNTASAIVARDASGDFSAGTITAALSGNASTATALQTARTINGTSFDGTANITVTAAAGTLTGSTLNSTVTGSSLTSVGTLTAGSIGTGFTAIPNSALANSSVTINGTAVALGASGTVTAAAGTLTGTSLAANVVSSSLTSVGTLTNLTVTNAISGSVTGSAGSVAAANITGTTLASGVTGSSLTSVGTLTSLAVTGDLTVDTSTLKVDSANNRVGIVTASPAHPLHVVGTSYLQQVIERATVSATAATGTINYDALTQAVLFYTSNASANWTLNLRGSSTVSMNTLLAVGDSMTVTFMVQQGTTPYYPTAHQIDGTSATVRWQGGTAPTAGNASSIDIYTYTIIKTAATPTYTLLGAQTRFA